MQNILPRHDCVSAWGGMEQIRAVHQQQSLDKSWWHVLVCLSKEIESGSWGLYKRLSSQGSPKIEFIPGTADCQCGHYVQHHLISEAVASRSCNSLRKEALCNRCHWCHFAEIVTQPLLALANGCLTRVQKDANAQFCDGKSWWYIADRCGFFHYCSNTTFDWLDEQPLCSIE